MKIKSAPVASEQGIIIDMQTALSFCISELDIWNIRMDRFKLQTQLPNMFSLQKIR